MSPKFFIVAGALLASTSAMAQAGPVAKVSSEQLVCQLSGDCGTQAAEPTQDKPDSRGFSIAKRVGATASHPANAQPQAATHAHVVNPAAHAAAMAPGNRHARPAAPRHVGRSNLSIGFVSGSATLTESGRAQAQEIVKALNSPQLTGKHFRIAGHTDAVGGRAYNLDLSQRRAQAVVDYLVGQGAARTQFEVKGYGFDQPLPGSSPRAASNRRVEVVKLD